MSERHEALKEIEKLRIGHRLSKGSSANCTTFQNLCKGKSTRSILAQWWHKGERQLAKERYIINAAENNPTQFGEIISQVDNGKKPVDSAYKEVKDELWRAQQLIDTEKLRISFWHFRINVSSWKVTLERCRKVSLPIRCP